MKRRALKAVIGFAALVPLSIVCLYTTPLSYPYSLAMESSWVKARTQRELEARLFAFYHCGRIDPSLTVWSKTPPGEGHSVFRYVIFDKERLDVVVAEDGTITDMFAAYE